MDYGKIAYEAYLTFVGGHSVHGEPLPLWEDQTDFLKEAWTFAANSVINSYPDT
jgi:hypothetical protein